MYERPDFLPRQDRLRRIGDSVLEVMDHAFVEIQLHQHSGTIEGLVQPDETAEQGLLQATLDERRRDRRTPRRLSSRAFRRVGSGRHRAAWFPYRRSA